MSPARFTDTITIGGGGGGPNPTDAFSLNIKTADSVPAATDAASFVMNMTFADGVGAPGDALKLGVGYADAIAAPTDIARAKWISNWLPATATVTDAVPPAAGNQWTTPDNAKLQDAAVATITAASTIGANADASSRLTLSGLAGTAPPAGGHGSRSRRSCATYGM